MQEFALFRRSAAARDSSPWCLRARGLALLCAALALANARSTAQLVAVDPLLGPPALHGPEESRARWTTLRDAHGNGVPLVEIPDAADADHVFGRFVFLAGASYATEGTRVAELLAAALQVRLDVAPTTLPEAWPAVEVTAGPAAICITFACRVEDLESTLRELVARLVDPDFERVPAHVEVESGPWTRLRELAGHPAPDFPSLRLDVDAPNETSPLAETQIAALRRHQALCVGTRRLWIAIGGSEESLAAARSVLSEAIQHLPAGGELPRAPERSGFQAPERTSVFWIEAPGERATVVFAGPARGATSQDARLVRARLALVARDLAAWLAPFPADGSDAWRLALTGTVSELAPALRRAASELSSREPSSGIEALDSSQDGGQRWGSRFERAYVGSDPLQAPLAVGADFDAAANRAWNELVARGRWLVVAEGPDDSRFLESLRELGPVTRLPQQGVQGDSPDAARELERAFDALGGRARWAELRTFELSSETMLEGFDEPVRTRTLQRIEPLGMRLEQTFGGRTQTTTVLESSSWTQSAERVVLSEPDEHRRLATVARRSLPHVLHRLAAEDELRARLLLDGETQRLEVYEAVRDRPILWFELGQDALPRRVGFSSPGDAGVVYAYADWQTVDGYVAPGRVLDVARGSVTRRTFRPDVEVEAAWFERPGEPR